MNPEQTSPNSAFQTRVSLLPLLLTYILLLYCAFVVDDTARTLQTAEVCCGDMFLKVDVFNSGPLQQTLSLSYSYLSLWLFPLWLLQTLLVYIKLTVVDVLG